MNQSEVLAVLQLPIGFAVFFEIGVLESGRQMAQLKRLQRFLVGVAVTLSGVPGLMAPSTSLHTAISWISLSSIVAATILLSVTIGRRLSIRNAPS
jgi:hypothetical protein